METPPLSQPQSDLARPTACYWVGAGSIAYTLIAAIAIVGLHLNWFGLGEHRALLRLHLYSCAFGTLGAAMAVTRKYYRVLITESTASKSGNPWKPVSWDIGWVYYYLTRPLLGGVIGALTFTLSFVGVHLITSAKAPDITTEGKYLLFGLAFLSGFSVSRVLDRLEALAKQLFKPEGAGVH